MKVRLTDNAIRLRLRKREAAVLAAGEAVRMTVTFGPARDHGWTVSVESNGSDPHWAMTLRSGRLSIVVPAMLLRDWANTDLVTIEQTMPGTGTHLSIEKDFACLHGSADNTDTFDHPAQKEPSRGG